MKKIILTILIIVSFLVPVAAFTWTGNITPGATFTGPFDDLSLEQTDRLSLGFQLPFNTSNIMSLAGEAYYEFGYSTALSNTADSTLSHLVDVNTLVFNMVSPLEGSSYFTLDAGRFYMADITRLTFSQPADGARFIYDSDNIQFNAYVGFTGLLNAHAVTMNVNPNENILSSVYTLAAPFVLGNALVHFPQLFAGQDLIAEIFTTIDVATSDDPTFVPDNRIYTTVALTGPLGDVLFYTLNSTLGLMQTTQEEWSISNLSAFELSALLPFANTLISWKTIFATGGTDSAYKTFTVNTASLDDSFEYAGNIKTGLVATITPLENLLVFAEPGVLINVANEDTDKGLSGFQWLLAARWDILSDLQLIASAGQFLPSDNTVDSYFEGEIKVSFNF